MQDAVREDEAAAEYLVRGGVVLTHAGATMEGFRDKGFATVPQNEQMRLQMKPGWQDLVPKNVGSIQLAQTIEQTHG